MRDPDSSCILGNRQTNGTRKLISVGQACSSCHDQLKAVVQKPIETFLQLYPLGVNMRQTHSKLSQLTGAWSSSTPMHLILPCFAKTKLDTPLEPVTTPIPTPCWSPDGSLLCCERTSLINVGFRSSILDDKQASGGESDRRRWKSLLSWMDKSG